MNAQESDPARRKKRRTWASAYTFTTADQGTHTFSGAFTLMTPGTWVLTATDVTGRFSAGLALTITP
jgi:hypothetical protein